MTLFSYTISNAKDWWGEYLQQTCRASIVQVASVHGFEAAASEAGFAAESAIFEYIQAGNRRFSLRRALAPRLIREGALWSCELDDLSLMGYGESREQAFTRFMEDFAVAYDGLVGKSDDLLTGDARRLRDKLSALVLSVESSECIREDDLKRTQDSVGPSQCLCATL